MSTGPLVTIGCAVYNGAATLARALAPVVEQDYPKLEILIVDDCSTDRSPEIYGEFARRDSRIRVIRNANNIGNTATFNLLAREARGKYFLWADQDDIRDRTFVSKTLAVMEANPDAVICHSYTGVFIGDDTDVKYLVTMYGVDGVRPLLLRYLRFLRYYSDTVLYGLIRTEALQRTGVYRPHLGSANALLFELLLIGPFIQVPEALHYYSGRGVRNRPSAKQEYARANPGRQMPWYYLPFLVLAWHQASGIVRAELNWWSKASLLIILWLHVGTVFATKLVYRVLAWATFDHVPDWFTRLCDSIVEPHTHLMFLNNSDRDDHLFPKAWSLKGKRS